MILQCDVAVGAGVLVEDVDWILALGSLAWPRMVASESDRYFLTLEVVSDGNVGRLLLAIS